MYLLPIILAGVLCVTAVPVNSPGIKERIFDIARIENEKVAAIRDILEIYDVSTRNSMLEDILWGVVDMLRNLIINGSNDVPVLDPFVLDYLHLSGDLFDLPNSHVTLKDIEVNNLSTFEIDQLQVSTVSIILQRYRIRLNARIPVLVAQTGNYDLSINIFGGNVFGNGDFNVRIVNPRIYSDIVVGVRLSINGVFLTVRECKIRFNLDAFQAQITGLFNDDVASDFVSSLLSSIVPELVEQFEDDITNILSSTVLEVANNILNDLNLIDLLP